jgi:hypothetical protein
MLDHALAATALGPHFRAALHDVVGGYLGAVVEAVVWAEAPVAACAAYAKGRISLRTMAMLVNHGNAGECAWLWPEHIPRKSVRFERQE